MNRLPPETALLGAMLAINRVLARENLAFGTFAVMAAIAEADAPLSISRTAARVGLSDHAVRKQLIRTHWFRTIPDPVDPTHRVLLTLTAEGLEKLARIDRKLATA